MAQAAQAMQESGTSVANQSAGSKLRWTDIGQQGDSYHSQAGRQTTRPADTMSQQWRMSPTPPDGEVHRGQSVLKLGTWTSACRGTVTQAKQHGRPSGTKSKACGSSSSSSVEAVSTTPAPPHLRHLPVSPPVSQEPASRSSSPQPAEAWRS